MMSFMLCWDHINKKYDVFHAVLEKNNMNQELYTKI